MPRINVEVVHVEDKSRRSKFVSRILIEQSLARMMQKILRNVK